MKLRWYRFVFDALPVTFHLRKDFHFHWQRIVGVQVGPWFVGAIRGSYVDPESVAAGECERHKQVRAMAKQRGPSVAESGGTS